MRWCGVAYQVLLEIQKSAGSIFETSLSGLRICGQWGARLTIFPCLLATAMIAALRANTTSLLKKLVSRSHDLEKLKYQVSATDH